MTFEVMNPKTLGMEDLNDKFGEQDDSVLDDMGRRIIRAGDQEYLVRAAHRSGLWEIFNPAGGRVPNELQGFFTNIRAAEQALTQYASRKTHEGIQAKRYHQNLVDKGFFVEDDRSAVHTHTITTDSTAIVEPIKIKKTKKKE